MQLCFLVFNINIIIILCMIEQNLKIKKVNEVQQILKKYICKPKKFQTNNLQIIKAIDPQNQKKVIIKLINSPSALLYQYLLKLKECKSDFVIKIIQIAQNDTQAVIVTQDIPYGSLWHNLKKCRRLDDQDCIFISKILLNGHVDLLKNQIKWFGNQKDIEFTQNGLKLSWSGSEPSNQNPFPNIIEKLVKRTEQDTIISFPVNPQISQMAKLSLQNASQISLNPIFKKKQKLAKRKGKFWYALREIKSKSQYYEQTIYLAASLSHGFIRVKVYQLGKFQNQVMKYYRQNRSFVKIIQNYDDQKNSYIISQYSNDGNILSYTAKLKSAGITLKEDQIQFFLYSLIEPIKLIQQSQILSLNYIHIKNIYLEDGIPKIGEPVPLKPQNLQIFKDRADVPDFYHPKFKSDPLTTNPSYDTYSLGILLYKLMYTEYPIFPQGKVHIPTTPAYNERIKQTLQIFLNQGGKLVDIEARIQISQKVRQKIRQNRLKLNKYRQGQQQFNQKNLDSQGSEIEQSQGILKRIAEYCCPKNANSTNKNIIFVLQTSNFKYYRSICKITFVILTYILLFYLNFITNFISLFSQGHLFQNTIVTDTKSSTTYLIIIPNFYKFHQSYNSMINTNSAQQIIEKLNCVIDTNSNYSDFLSSKIWYIYLIFSMLVLIIMMICKAIQLSKFDFMTALYNYKYNVSNYNISAWIIFNLLFAEAIYSHFFLFNYVFSPQVSPCFGGNTNNWFSTTTNLFQNRAYMAQYLLPPLMFGFLIPLISFFLLIYHVKIPYNRLFNPIVILIPFLIAMILIMRIGLYNPFEPSLINDPNNIIKGYFKSKDSSTNFFGIIPQLLVLIELGIILLVELIFYLLLQQRLEKFMKLEESTYEIQI